MDVLYTNNTYIDPRNDTNNWVSLNPEMKKLREKMLTSVTNPEESKIFMVVHMEDASQMKTFGERPDIFKARTEAGADVASTTVISPIGEDWLPN